MDTAYIKKVILRIFIFALCGVAIVYLLYHTFSLYDADMEAEPVQSALWKESVSLTGTVFRRETVLYTENSGEINRLYSDGERVGANSAVATVYHSLSGADPALLVQLDEKIALLEESNDVSVSDRDLSYTDSRIKKLYYSVRLARENGDEEYAKSLSRQLLVLMNKREIITRQRLDFNAELAELYAEREKLLQGSEDAYETVKAPSSGYFYKDVDGYEGVFDPDIAKNGDYSQLLALSDMEPASTSGTAGKLVTAAKWYIVFFSSTDITTHLSEGEGCVLEFPDSSSCNVNFTVERIVPDKDGKNAAYVLSTDIMPESFSYTRQQEFSLIYDTAEGLRVPDSALRVLDGQIGVYILKDNKTTFRRVDIISQRDGYSLVVRHSPDTSLYTESLHLYDLVITAGKDIKEEIKEIPVPISDKNPFITVK